VDDATGSSWALRRTWLIYEVATTPELPEYQISGGAIFFTKDIPYDFVE
jgi:hypothetical protein